MQGNNNNMRFSENETFSTLRTFNKQAHSSNRKKLSLIKKGNNLLNRLKLEAVDQQTPKNNSLGKIDNLQTNYDKPIINTFESGSRNNLDLSPITSPSRERKTKEKITNELSNTQDIGNGYVDTQPIIDQQQITRKIGSFNHTTFSNSANTKGKFDREKTNNFSNYFADNFKLINEEDDSSDKNIEQDALNIVSNTADKTNPHESDASRFYSNQKYNLNHKHRDYIGKDLVERILDERKNSDGNSIFSANIKNVQLNQFNSP